MAGQVSAAVRAQERFDIGQGHAGFQGLIHGSPLQRKRLHLAVGNGGMGREAGQGADVAGRRLVEIYASTSRFGCTVRHGCVSDR